MSKGQESIEDSEHLINSQRKSSTDSTSNSKIEDLPETIEVYVIDSDSGTAYLGKVNTYTGEFVAEEDRWFDMKGRRLNAKPTTKGIYYYNGKQVLVR